LKHGVDHLKRLVDLLPHLRACQYDLPAHKDQKHNLGLDHPVDETGEQLGLVGAEHVMTAGKTFKTDREFDIAGTNDVLDLEVGELCVEAKLLDDSRIYAVVSIGRVLPW